LENGAGVAVLPRAGGVWRHFAGGRVRELNPPEAERKFGVADAKRREEKIRRFRPAWGPSQ
jgi:hypothetical protein